jgi:hypothetical protein
MLGITRVEMTMLARIMSVAVIALFAPLRK